MFEGLASPLHLVIIAFVLFMAIGPKRIAKRWTATSDKLRKLTDGEAPGAAGSGDDTTQGSRVVSRTGLYRLAPFFRRRP